MGIKKSLEMLDKHYESLHSRHPRGCNKRNCHVQLPFPTDTPISGRYTPRYRGVYRVLLLHRGIHRCQDTISHLAFKLSGAQPIVPNSDEAGEGDRQMNADELRDYADQDIMHNAFVGPYDRFLGQILANMPDWIKGYDKNAECLPLLRNSLKLVV
jgi:hypothetical protein